MSLVKPIHGKLSSPFNEPRPLSNPGKHIHGAVDISNKINTPIIAPEDGLLIPYLATRPKDGMSWPAGEWPKYHEKDFPYANYFYDMYGGLLVLRAYSGRTHVFTHIFGNTLFNSTYVPHVLTKPFHEEKKECRFPLISFMGVGVSVKAGQKIGKLGNSGYSSGPHVHYEIHNGWSWNKHEDRINPEKLFDWQ